MSDRSAQPRRAPTLLLFPTELERSRFEGLGDLPPDLCLRATCGFGPVVSAARTASLIATLTPRAVFLTGIAGSYDLERDPLGAARSFEAVSIDGVGAGEGPGRLGPAALGLPQWPGAPGEHRERIDERVELTAPPADLGLPQRALLLTVCAAAGDRDQAEERRQRFDAAAEDMEGFAVAAACALAGVPCSIVRGISNLAGDRDHARWSIGPALEAARASLLPWLESVHGGAR